MKNNLPFPKCVYLFVFSIGIIQAFAQLSPVVLPLYENFEKAQGAFAQDSNCIYCDTNIQFDARFIVPGFFQKEISFNYGYSNTSIGANDSVSALLHGQNSVNALRATIDMSNYDTSDASSVLLSFFHYDHYDEVHPEDEVLIKGTASSPWISIYNLGRNGVDGEWVEASNINISEILRANNQNFSSSFKIRFTHKDNDFDVLNDGISIDDILLEEVSCAPVSEVKMLNATNKAVDVSWKPGSNLALTEIYYAPSGYHPASFTGIRRYANSSSGFLSLNSLAANTCYDFYFRNICGLGDSSKWIGPLEFCTNCELIKLPYFENFDGLTTGVTGNLGNCWVSSIRADINITTTSTGPGIPYFFKGNRNAGTTTPLGPFNQASAGYGAYILGNRGTSNAADTTYLELNAPVDLSSMASPELRFSYHILTFSSPIANNQLLVQVDSGNGWHNLQNIVGPYQNSRSAPWRNAVISLNQYQGLVRIRFRSINDYYVNHVAIDNIAIDKPLTCERPNLVQASAISQNSATISFNSNVGSAVPHEISYGPNLIIPQNGVKSVFTGSSLNITNLVSGQQYCVFLRNLCATGDTSYWSKMYCFNTECPPINAPYSQNFDSLTATPMPLCWRAIGPQTDTTVHIVSSTDQGISMPSPPFGVEINDGVSPVMLVSPKFADLKSGLNRIRFKAAYEISASYFPDDTLFIGTLTDVNNPGSFKRLTYLNILPPRGQFQEYIIDLTDTALLDNNVHLAFKYGTDLRSRFEYYIDDFAYEEISACPRPSGLVVTDSTCADVELIWTSPNNTSVLKYETKNNGQTITTHVGHVTSPYLVQGLDYWKKYNFFIADTCSGDTSVFFGPVAGSPDDDHLPTAKLVVLKDSTYAGVTYLTLDGSQSVDAKWYDWDFGDGRTATGPVVNITFTKSGLATIVLRVRNSCFKNDTALFRYQVISLDEKRLSQILVYPNPTKGAVTVDLGEEYLSFTHFDVYNSIGQLVSSKPIDKQNTIELNLIGPPGMYLIKVYGKLSREMKFKVLKE